MAHEQLFGVIRAAHSDLGDAEMMPEQDWVDGITNWAIEIDGQLERSTDGEAALGELMSLTTCINDAVGERRAIIEKLKELLGRVRQLLAKIARLLKALSYSISVSAPFGVSIGLSFTPSPDSGHGP